MCRKLSYLILTGTLFGACVDVLSIATSNNVISAQSPTNQGYSLNWEYIYKYKESSSVAVDHYWILTAGHVGDDGGSGSLTVNGETYTQQEVVVHPTADLALVRYDMPFPGYYSLHNGEIHNGKSGGARVYDPLVMVGFGYPGTVTATTFTQSGSRGIKRWGTNRGVGESLINADVGGAISNRSTQCFQTTFVLADTPYEAGGNIYDSGGPVFIERDSEWKLAGINIYRDGIGPFTGNWAALIPDYVAWIQSVIVDYDTDMDGLPDWWELAYGGDTTSMVATVDLDGDFFTNLDEWFSDTNPTNSASFLDTAYSPPDSVLIFHGSTNRQYQIEYRASLVDTNEAWQVDVDWFGGTDTQMVQSVSAASNGFYRVRANLP